MSLISKSLRSASIIITAPTKRMFSRPVRRPPSSRTKGPAKALVPVEEAWVPVADKNSGQVYWWNEQTNQTTALGGDDSSNYIIIATLSLLTSQLLLTAPRPGSAPAAAVPPPAAPAPAPGGGGIMSGLGGVMAEGFAFGVGSSIARNVVGSFFNSGDSGGGDSGDDGIDL